MLFAHRLALACGEWDVDSMLQQISWRQLERWMQYYAVEPWGVETEDGRAAMLTAAIYNTDQRRKGSAKARDFMPRRRGRRQSMEEQKAILRAATRRAS